MTVRRWDGVVYGGITFDNQRMAIDMLLAQCFHVCAMDPEELAYRAVLVTAPEFWERLYVHGDGQLHPGIASRLPHT